MTMRNLIPWSYSKLATYEKCPAQAKYRYIDFLPSPKSPQAERGIIIHKSFEDFLRRVTKTMHPEAEHYKEFLVEARRDRTRVEVKVAIDREWKIVDWKHKKAWGRSVIDGLKPPDDTRIDAFEWKTGKIYDDHVEQRRTYLIFMAAMYPELATYSITTYYIDQDTARKTTLPFDRIKEAKRDLALRLWHMENDDRYQPRPGFYCGFCPFSRFKGGPCRVG